MLSSRNSYPRFLPVLRPECKQDQGDVLKEHSGYYPQRCADSLSFPWINISAPTGNNPDSYRTTCSPARVAGFQSDKKASSTFRMRFLPSVQTSPLVLFSRNASFQRYRGFLPQYRREYQHHSVDFARFWQRNPICQVVMIKIFFEIMPCKNSSGRLYAAINYPGK